MYSQKLVSLINQRENKLSSIGRYRIMERDASEMKRQFKIPSERKGSGQYAYDTYRKRVLSKVNIEVDEAYDHYGNCKKLSIELEENGVQSVFLNDIDLYERFMTQYLSYIRNKIQHLQNEYDTLTKEIKENL